MKAMKRISWSTMILSCTLFVGAAIATEAPPARGTEVVEVSGRDFERYVLKSPVPVLVDFYAHWCGPCRLQSPILEKAASKIRIENARIAKINVDENGRLSAAYRVNSIPTLLVFKDGKVVARHTGLATEERIKALLGD